MLSDVAAARGQVRLLVCVCVCVCLYAVLIELLLRAVASRSLDAVLVSCDRFRSTLKSRPNNAGRKCPSVRQQKVSSILMKFVM